MGASLSAAVRAAAVTVWCSEGYGSHLFLPTFAHEHMVTCPGYPPGLSATTYFTWFDRALSLGRAQGARLWQVRAATSLARDLRAQL